jgi:hypothetical protein
MEEAYKETEKNGNEHGFRVGQKGTVSVMVEGTEEDINAEAWMPAIDDLRDKKDYVAYDVHTHPKPDYNGGADVPYNNIPSGTDTDNIVGNKPNVVLGYYYTERPVSNQFGGLPEIKHDRYIGFFNKNGLLNTENIPFSSFKRAATKINK